MTVKEWRENNQDISHTMVWASDTRGGFGRKGDMVSCSYERANDMEIIAIESKTVLFPEPHTFAKLHVWDAIVSEPIRKGVN